MKLFSKLSAVGAVLVLGTAFASATTYELGSYGTGQSNMGNINSSMVFYGVGGTCSGVPATCTNPPSSTVNIPATAPWNSSLTGTSSWVSYTQSSPSGPVTPANGEYWFSTTFTLAEQITSFTINLLADDTVTVYLDGINPSTNRLALRDAGANVTCQVGIPNCTTVSTFSAGALALAILNAPGNHTLYFDVSQTNGDAMGVDFTATASNVPEPGTLLLLGTGLIGSAGTLMRRMRKA